MITFKEYKAALQIVISYKKQIEDIAKMIEHVSQLYNIENMIITRETLLDDIMRSNYCSVRLRNILRSMIGKEDIKLDELKNIKVDNLKRTRNAGRHTIGEFIRLQALINELPEHQEG